MQRPRSSPPALAVIAAALERLANDVAEVKEDGKVTRSKVELLNDWHNRVTGALWVIGGLASAALAVGLIVLRAVVGG